MGGMGRKFDFWGTAGRVTLPPHTSGSPRAVSDKDLHQLSSAVAGLRAGSKIVKVDLRHHERFDLSLVDLLVQHLP